VIFDLGTDVFESEKERNLYYKVFAGYLLNEYVDGFEARLDRFCEWINHAPHRGKAAHDIHLELAAETTHVSFDNHAYMLDNCGADRGEFADVLVHDRTTKSVVTIEAKVHSDWSYPKDIEANDARIRRIEGQMVTATFVPCLLIRKEKWEQAERMQNHPQSNYRSFVERDDNRFRVLFWEDLAAMVGSQDVKALIETVLAHPPNFATYRFADGWFFRA